MSPKQDLPPGFIHVEEAIALIQKDTRENAVVDLQFLANNIPYMRVNGNYNIRLLKTVEDPVTHQHKVVRNGSVYVTLYSEYDKQVLLRAITDAFEERTKVKLDTKNIGINKVTSMVDEEKGANDARIVRPNQESTIKPGDNISESYEKVLQGV